MKANVKRRQQLNRDMMAFKMLLLWVLNTLHGAPWNWGRVRLQRVYDKAMELMFEASADEFAGELLLHWGEGMGLTEEARMARKEKAAKAA